MSLDLNDQPALAAGTSRGQQAAILLLALLLLLLGLHTIEHFLTALAWAGIFAIALWPAYQRAVRRFGLGRHKLLLPAAFTLAVALVFIVPLALVGFQLAREGHAAADWIHGAEQNGIPEPAVVHSLPFAHAPLAAWWQGNLADPGRARMLVEHITHGHVENFSRKIGGQVIRRLTSFVFTLLTLFFLFRDGDTLTSQMRRGATRAFGPSGERLGGQIIASVHGTVDGLVLVGLGEGLLLGIVYAVAGVPHPTVFGLLTAVAAMIPFGAIIAFGLAALLLAANGAVAWAIAVLVCGMVVTFVADHFIRPVLIGGATKLPFIWVLLGILGGVEVWGLTGLFLGPAIMAALVLLWREWTSVSGNSA